MLPIIQFYKNQIITHCCQWVQYNLKGTQGEDQDKALCTQKTGRTGLQIVKDTFQEKIL